MRMTIEVLADPLQSGRIAANLSKIVHVLSVTTEGDAGPIPPGTNGRRR